MKRSINIVLIFFFFFSLTSAQKIRIGLFHNSLVESFVFNCQEGHYSVESGDSIVAVLVSGDLLYITIEQDQIKIDNGSDISGSFNELKFTDPSLKSEFSIKPASPNLDSRNYNGELEVDIKFDAFRLINILEFDQYLAGVVEAEAGPGAPDEFFKVQAVLCRTYAVKNWEKHISEGFNLCDEVHCQAFKGKNDMNPDILKSVYSTHSIVIADFSYKLISAVYHSNSGGETQKAAGFWPGNGDYLLSILDPFASTGKNYSWKEKISWSDWTDFLKEKGIKPEKLDSSILLIKQDHRKLQFIIQKDTIPLKDLRQRFGFKSSFFNMESLGDEIIVNGRGYGHGVGLSQEGAMEMARQGYSYMDILRFYYHNIRINDLNDLPFNSVPEIFR